MFGNWITHFTWEEINDNNDPSVNLLKFLDTIQIHLDMYVPSIQEVQLHSAADPGFEKRGAQPENWKNRGAPPKML